jgi:uncharacterized protein
MLIEMVGSSPLLADSGGFFRGAPEQIAADLVALFLVVLGPVWDYVESRPLRAAPSGALRMRYYVRTIVWLWVATGAAVWAVGFSSLMTLRGIGIQVEWLKRYGWVWWVLAVLLAAIVMVQLVLPVLQVSMKYRDREFLEPKQLVPLRFFLPATPNERGWFVVLCVTAGICEEVLFRGFLMRYLYNSPLQLGLLPAILVAAMVFGTHHFYQGVKGFVSTSIGGFIFAGILLVTGSLWAGMVYHAAADLSLLMYWRPRPEVKG